MIGSARRLAISSDTYAKCLIAAAPPVFGFKHVRILIVDSYRLSLYEIMCLLKALPALATLRCSVGGVGSELGHIASKDLPDHVASTYRKAGDNLLIWSIPDYQGRTHDNITEIVMLLALACPRLQRMNLSCKFGPKFEAEVVETLASKAFSKYNLQLNRLVHAACY
ncbi:hypothetical protein GGH95_000861 [Coemansia sp. RSA 1836]|nr:hypothetical protein GGH95_000861 [Coemansia sp. RSA 1836]